MAGNGRNGGKRLWEDEMLAEYLAGQRPNGRVMHRVRLGPPTMATAPDDLSDAERRMIGAAWRRWADALIIDADQLVVIEAKMVPDPRDVSQLELYVDMIDSTPELSEWRHLPRFGRLLWAFDDPFTRALAGRHGLQVVVYKPSHLEEFLTVIRERQRRPVRSVMPGV